MPRNVVGGGAYSARQTLTAQLVTVTKAISDSNHIPVPPMSPTAPKGVPNDINIPLVTTAHAAENTHAVDSQRNALFLLKSPLGDATSKVNGVATAKTIAAL